MSMQITLRNDDDGQQAMEADEQHESRRSDKPRVIITTRHGAASGSAATSAPRHVVKTKGRGFQSRYESEQEERYSGRGGQFESIDESGNSEAQKSVEGWILIVTGLHEETNEDDLYELFADHGDIKQLHLNLDRRTGYVKGYALIEYGAFSEAQSALTALQGHELHEKAITVDWAFKVPPQARAGGRGHGGARGAGQQHRQTSSSSGGRGPRDERR